MSSPPACGATKGEGKEAGGRQAEVGLLLSQVSWIDVPDGLAPQTQDLLDTVRVP